MIMEFLSSGFDVEENTTLTCAASALEPTNANGTDLPDPLTITVRIMQALYMASSCFLSEVSEIVSLSF